MGHLGGFRGHKFKSLGKLSNGWTDWHHIWYTSVDSSGNGHRLKTIRPTIPQGGILGGFMGINFVCMNLGMNGHRLKKHGPKDTKGSILMWG